MDVKNNLDALLGAVKQANQAILNIYDKPSFDVENKADDSPITEADKASHLILISAIAELFPDTPIVSEEDDHNDTFEKLQSDAFWLIDPLDGTKEFVNKNGQFSVCIALVKHGRPFFGIVSIPTQDTLYYGGPEFGSFKQIARGEPEVVQVAPEPTNIVTASLSHLNEATERYIGQHYPDATIARAGSSLKAMMVAEGLADAQPVLGGQMKLWDLAAGHAIVVGAGGFVTRPDGNAVNYQPTDTLLVGDFVTRATGAL